MRHRLEHRKLNRSGEHRKALLMNLSNSLVVCEQIKTTLPKAKELRPFVEKLITLGKNGDLNSRRLALSILRDEKAVRKIFGELSEKFRERKGGYVRIMKCGFRVGDRAPMAIVQLVE
ncbi:MAG: 50S ribosomal protein L17 [Rickettsiales bacterium]|jgi:large subunit ribosomal protein L17|nr:50S ribosomal protein L17 [Rickettsiales bacterium]